MDYNRLINKYYTNEGENMTAIPKRNKYEQTSNEYVKQQKRESSLRFRHALLTELLLEIPFHLPNDQVAAIRYWLNIFNSDFKDFHRQSSNETIILAFIMIQRKQVIPGLNVEKLSICRKYGLTSPVFEVIQNRLIFQLMKSTPLMYNQKIVLDNFIEDKKTG